MICKPYVQYEDSKLENHGPCDWIAGQGIMPCVSPEVDARDVMPVELLEGWNF